MSASSFTMSKNNIVAGLDSVVLTVDKVSDTRRHRFTMNDTEIGRLDPGVSDFIWSPTVNDLASVFLSNPSTKNYYVPITLYTYDTSTGDEGTNTSQIIGVYLSFSDGAPEVQVNFAESASGHYQIFGGLIPGYTKGSVVLSNIVTKYGASLASVISYVNGNLVSGIFTIPKTSADELSLETYVTDSRGFTVIDNQSIPLIQNYSAPTIYNVSIYRCDENGNPDDEKTYLRCDIEYNITNISESNINEKRIKILYKEIGSEITKSVDILPDTYTGTKTHILSNIPLNTNYHFNITLSDTITSSSIEQDYLENSDVFRISPDGLSVFIGNSLTGSNINIVKDGGISAGKRCSATGQYSFAEGYLTSATGENSHSEGYRTTASNYYSHAEGYYTTASGNRSHAEGSSTTANGQCSHAEGSGTIASGIDQHVQGRCNVPDSVNAFIIGNGKSTSERSNALTVDWSGNLRASGKLYSSGHEMAANETISNAWSGTKTYVPGDYVIYDYTLWKCKTQNIGEVPTDGEYWGSTSIALELKNGGGGGSMRQLDYANAIDICDHDVVNLQPYHQDFVVPKDGMLIITGLSNRSVPAGFAIKIWGQTIARSHTIGAGSAVIGFDGETSFMVSSGDDIDIDGPSGAYVSGALVNAFMFVPYKD